MPYCPLRRQREEEAASLGAHHIQASAQFEEDLQTLQASIDAEYGKDSNDSGKGASMYGLSAFSLSLSLSLSLAVSDDNEDSDLPSTDLFCPACNKFFKTANA